MKLNLATKTFLIKIFAVLMVIGMMDSAAFSQTRIRFAKGRSSTTINGTLSSNGNRIYIVNAKRGQRMTLKVKSKVPIDIYVDDTDGLFDGGTIDLTFSGDHKISINNENSRSTTYSLYVEIR